MFGIIFLMILFLNLAKIHLSRQVELLRGNNTGEKEPVAKWLMALIGFICLGAGYYLAVTTESPIKAITIFLLAVILVMAGTYLLFTAGSIVILKFLRRRKSLLQDWKFYQHIGNALSNEAERNRSGKYLYTKYRCSAYDCHDSFHLFRNE